MKYLRALFVSRWAAKIALRHFSLALSVMNMRTLLLLTLLGIAQANHAGDFKGCDEDPRRLKLRSAELHAIMQADQDDRKGPIDWAIIGKRDESRRKRVGEIFGEGCFSKAEDYGAAALVFQHGNQPEHAFQCYLWAKEAVARGLLKMGEVDLKLLSLSGADRYLVGKKHKQLFATQYNRLKSNKDCRCLQPIESSFSDQQRIDAGSTTIHEALQYVLEKNASIPACKGATFCDSELEPSPKGILPGIW